MIGQDDQDMVQGSSGLPAFVSVEDLVKILSVSKSLVYKWIDKKSIPHYRFDKAIRFDLAQVRDWLQSKSVDRACDPESGGEGVQTSDRELSSPECIRSSSSESLERDVDRILKSNSIRGKL
jgi:excisionase family DNA binding protein